MVKPLIVITGASSGIGFELAKIITERGYEVLAIARRKHLLENLAKENSLISILPADISKLQDRKRIIDFLEKKDQPIYLVNNAAISMPKTLQILTLEEWEETRAINFEAPMCLLKECQAYFSHSRILNISSGLAHYALSGTAAYCLTKAALYMLYQLINVSYDPSLVIAGSLRPGIVDTPMHAVLRGADESIFPEKNMFQAFYDNDQLADPKKVANFIAAVLLDTEDKEFKEKEWDIDVDYKSFKDLDRQAQ